jgi:RimJ/RimL family protein N-acetyltransferase
MVEDPDGETQSPDEEGRGRGPAGWESARIEALLLRSGNEALLQHVFVRAADYFQRVVGAAGPAPDAAEQEIAACARTEGRDVALLSLRESGEPVGVIGWWRGNPEPDTALLGMLLLVPEQRGAGLGREAVTGLEGWLVGQGVRRLRTAVGAAALAEHRLLRSLGFQLLPVRDHASLGLAGSHLLLWQKPIGPEPTGSPSRERAP